MAKTFVQACKQFFGMKDGQTLGEFAKELKELTPEDREEMIPLLAEALGEEVVLKTS